jgi:hypothetical protein
MVKKLAFVGATPSPTLYPPARAGLRRALSKEENPNRSHLFTSPFHGGLVMNPSNEIRRLAVSQRLSACLSNHYSLTTNHFDGGKGKNFLYIYATFSQAYFTPRGLKSTPRGLEFTPHGLEVAVNTKKPAKSVFSRISRLINHN